MMVSLGSQNPRITESSMLEKTSKIMKSNRLPNTTVPAKPCPEVPHLHGFLIPSEMGTPPLPWALFQQRNFSKCPI